MNWWNVQTPDGDWVASRVSLKANEAPYFEREKDRVHAADFTENQAKFIAKRIGGTAHEVIENVH